MLPYMHNVPYFFYIFDHLKIINFFADRKIGITPKLTENLEPNTNSIPDAPVHVKLRAVITSLDSTLYHCHQQGFSPKYRRIVF